jgi:hypothetical protein
MSGFASCVYCGEQATSIDHVKPRWAGGSDDMSNLVPACTSCNSRKSIYPSVVLEGRVAIAQYLKASGFMPLHPRRVGKTSHWMKSGDAQRIWYTRAAALLCAAKERDYT